MEINSVYISKEDKLQESNFNERECYKYSSLIDIHTYQLNSFDLCYIILLLYIQNGHMT